MTLTVRALLWLLSYKNLFNILYTLKVLKIMYQNKIFINSLNCDGNLVSLIQPGKF